MLWQLLQTSLEVNYWYVQLLWVMWWFLVLWHPQKKMGHSKVAVEPGANSTTNRSPLDGTTLETFGGVLGVNFIQVHTWKTIINILTLNNPLEICVLILQTWCRKAENHHSSCHNLLSDVSFASSHCFVCWTIFLVSARRASGPVV